MFIYTMLPFKNTTTTTVHLYSGDTLLNAFVFIFFVLAVAVLETMQFSLTMHTERFSKEELIFILNSLLFPINFDCLKCARLKAFDYYLLTLLFLLVIGI